MPDQYFDDNQWDNLKRVGLFSLLAGSGIAGTKHILNSFNSGLDNKAFSTGTPGNNTIEVPVPGQEALPGASYNVEKRQARKARGKGRKYKPFSPGSGVSIKDTENEKQSEWKTEDLANMAYAPALVAATGAGLGTGYGVINHLFREKRKRDAAQELEDAKREFGEALVEAHSNRLPEPVKATGKPGFFGQKKAEATSTTLAQDLEKLASICLKASQEKKAEVPPGPIQNFFSSVADKAMQGASAVGSYMLPTLEDLKALGGQAFEAVKPYATGYAGLAGALALGAGAIGTNTGYTHAKNNDPEELEHQRYLNEFLTRRQSEGMPIYSVPVPVKVNKKKNTLTPKSDVTEQLSEEA